MQANPAGPESTSPDTTGSGLAPNVASALSYVLGLVTGVVFFLIEKDKTVRFHAMQSIIVSIAWILIWVAFSIVGAVISSVSALYFLFLLVQALISLVLGLGGLILWIMLILKAYQGQQWKLPYIGDMAERYASALNP